MSSRSKSVRTEKYPRPRTPEAVCSLVREILTQPGLVQRIEIDVDEPVRVQRQVEEGDPDLVEIQESWDGALKNVEGFLEYYSEGASSFQVIFDMLQLVAFERLHGTCWVTGVGQQGLLSRWFEFEERGMPATGIDTILGLPVHRLGSLPEETLILCGSKYLQAEPSEIELVVKTSIEIRSEGHGREQRKTLDAVDGRSGDHSQELFGATNPLDVGSGGLKRCSWHTPSIS